MKFFEARVNTQYGGLVCPETPDRKTSQATNVSSFEITISLIEAKIKASTAV